MDAEGRRALVKRASEIEAGEMMAVKLGDSCSLTIEGRDGKLLWLELVGNGTMNEFLWDEIVERANEVGRPDENHKRPHPEEGGL